MMKARFDNLWIGLGVEMDMNDCFQFLQESYQQPQRFYHNFQHVESCLEDFERVRQLAQEPELVEVALWYHDVVYDAKAKDNEERSAELAKEACLQAGVSEQRGQMVHDLIMATKHHCASDSIDLKIITDVDLAILGKSTEAYDCYERNIRKEYSFVPDAVFCQGRAAVLQDFLDRPVIYSIEYFIDCYQERAVENLQRAISNLVTK